MRFLTSCYIFEGKYLQIFGFETNNTILYIRLLGILKTLWIYYETFYFLVVPEYTHISTKFCYGGKCVSMENR